MHGTLPKVWGIHAGPSFSYDSTLEQLYLNDNLIGHWSPLGLWQDSPSDWSEFVALTQARRDNETRPQEFASDVRRLFEFIHKAQIGDVIALASSFDQRVHLGRIVGSHFTAEQMWGGPPHMRSVEWVRDFSRLHFTIAALHELAMPLDFFEVWNTAEEFRAAMSEPSLPVAPSDLDR